MHFFATLIPLLPSDTVKIKINISIKEMLRTAQKSQKSYTNPAQSRNKNVNVQMLDSHRDVNNHVLYSISYAQHE